MAEWYNNQKKPNSNFRKLLQERTEKSNPRLKLLAEESKRLSKLQVIACKLKRRETVQSDGCVTHYLHTNYEAALDD